MTLRRNKDAYSELEMHFHVSQKKEKDAFNNLSKDLSEERPKKIHLNQIFVSQVLSGLEPPLDLSTTIFGHKVVLKITQKLN